MRMVPGGDRLDTQSCGASECPFARLAAATSRRNQEGNGTVLQNLFSVRVAKVAAHIAPPDLAVGATLQPYHRHCQSQPEDHTPCGASGLSEPFCPCGWVAIIALPILANRRGALSLEAAPIPRQFAVYSKARGESGQSAHQRTSAALNPRANRQTRGRRSPQAGLLAAPPRSYSSSVSSKHPIYAPLWCIYFSSSASIS